MWSNFELCFSCFQKPVAQLTGLNAPLTSASENPPSLIINQKCSWVCVVWALMSCDLNQTERSWGLRQCKPSDAYWVPSESKSKQMPISWAGWFTSLPQTELDLIFNALIKLWHTGISYFLLSPPSLILQQNQGEEETSLCSDLHLL